MDDVTYLDAESVFGTLSPAEAVAALTDTVAGGFDPSADIPRTISEISSGNMIYMPAEIGDWVGVKLAGVATGNPELGLPRIMAQYLMYESRTLTLCTILDGAALTTLRTPAVSVAAVKPALGRFTSAVKILVYGAGPQGLGHAKTLAAVLDVPIADITFVVRSPENVTDEVHQFGRVLEFGTAEVDAAVSAADILVCATTAGEPLFTAELVKSGAVVMACGSHDPNSRELPAELFLEATTVVETTDSALRECGDIVLAIKDGTVDAGSLVTMKDIITAEVIPEPQRTLIFKGSGMSWEDLAVAARLVEARKSTV